MNVNVVDYHFLVINFCHNENNYSAFIHKAVTINCLPVVTKTLMCVYMLVNAMIRLNCSYPTLLSASLAMRMPPQSIQQ